MSNKQKQIYMYVAFFIMLAINTLANILPINGYTTGEVSNMYTVFFTPASYTFTIWTVIYIAIFLWLLSFSLKRQKLRHSPYWSFLLTCFFNSLWILTWHYLFDGVSLIIIILLFITLLYLYQSQRRHNKSFKFLFPISLYTGWITVASITNTMYWLTASAEIDSSTQMILTYLALAIVILIGFAVIFLFQDWIIITVFIWSMIGIGVKNFQDNWMLTLITFILIAFLVVVSVLYWFRTRNVSKTE